MWILGRRTLVGRCAAALVASAAIAIFLPGSVSGETLESALVNVYQNNPSLNSGRASLRATDESVPQALSGYRPNVSIAVSAGEQRLSSTTKTPGSAGPPNVPATYSTESGYNSPYGVGVTMTQTLFNGFQTENRTRQAESQVLAARENLRLTEQTILLSAVTAYMNLLHDGAILELQQRNVQVLQELLRQTRERFKVGEVTRTDVAQSETSLAAGRSQALLAQANYTASVATYRQIIGTTPGEVNAATPVDRFSPRKLSEALAIGGSQHPSVIMAEYNVDVAQLQVKVAEGTLYPTLSLQGNFQKNYMNVGNLDIMQSYTASILGQLSVPIYQGGAEYSLIRQAKETLGQKRLDLETAREQARQTITQSWGQLDAAKANIQATQAQVQAAETALNGIREEARVGQRTTFDVLTAQQSLVNARVALVTAQHDRVVASYTLLAAVGRLSCKMLGLHVPSYNAQVHYQQVRDSWAGVRTPDAR